VLACDAAAPREDVQEESDGGQGFGFGAVRGRLVSVVAVAVAPRLGLGASGGRRAHRL
jgi:hypothetical protein